MTISNKITSYDSLATRLIFDLSLKVIVFFGIISPILLLPQSFKMNATLSKSLIIFFKTAIHFFSEQYNSFLSLYIGPLPYSASLAFLFLLLVKFLADDTSKYTRRVKLNRISHDRNFGQSKTMNTEQSFH